MNNNILSTLGICRKAGKLIMGFDAAKEAIGLDKACLIAITSDISPKTAKEIRFFAGKKNLPVCTLPISMEDIHSRFNRRCGVLAVCDNGLANTLERNSINKED